MIDLGKLSNNGKHIICKQLANGCIECISHCTDDDGYTRVQYKGKQERLFRVLYTIQHGDIPSGMVIRHMCNNPNCCNVDHLKIGTHKDNMLDMIKCGHSLKNIPRPSIKGIKNPSNKLTEKEVIDIYLSDLTYTNLSKIYKVSKTNISHIKNKRQWSWLTDTLD